MDRKNVEDIYRLSPVQQGILYHALYDPDGVAYFEQFRVEIPGRLDPELLAEMWRRAVARQGALRTSFGWKGLEEPVQVVHKAVELPVAIHDLTDGSPEEIQVRAAEILVEDRRRGFDLSQAPLVRLHVLRLEEERWLVQDHVDLRAFLSARLEDLGLDPAALELAGPCTASTPELASYRRDGADAGRQWSMIYRTA
jgi:hypothetical protein